MSPHVNAFAMQGGLAKVISAITDVVPHCNGGSECHDPTSRELVAIPTTWGSSHTLTVIILCR
jgi:hypothetical protein